VPFQSTGKRETRLKGDTDEEFTTSGEVKGHFEYRNNRGREIGREVPHNDRVGNYQSSEGGLCYETNGCITVC